MENTFLSFMHKYADAVKLVMDLSDIMFNISIDQSVGVACTQIEPGKRANIYINPAHVMFNTPNEQLNIRNLLGVLIHEMLHKKYTDPTYEKIAVGRSDANGNPIVHPNLFHTINNILEDFVIESRCILTLDVQPDVIKLLKKTKRIDLQMLHPVDNLDSAILTSWKSSPPIKVDDDDLRQIKSAMIMFTDMGPLVPGSKLKEDLKPDLSRVYEELMASVFEEPQERIKRAVNIYTIVDKYCPNDVAPPSGTCTGKNGDAQKSLSQDEIDKMSSSPRMQGQKELLKKIVKSLKASADNSEGNSEKQDAQSAQGNSSEKSDATSEKKNNSDASSQSGNESSKNDSENKKSGAGQTSEENESGKNDQTSDPASSMEGSDKKESTTANESNSESESTENGDLKDASSESKDPGESPEPEKDNSDNGETDPAEEGPDKTEESANENGSESDKSDESDGEEADASNDPSDNEGEDETDPFLGDSSLIATSIKEAEEKISKEKINVSEIEEVVRGDFNESQKKDTESVSVVKETMNTYAEKIECRNYTVTGVSVSTEKAYQAIIEENRTFVSRFSKKLCNLAKEEEQLDAAKSGHLSITRYARKNQTSLRVFEKRTKKERTDSRVIICLDCSGSMEGNKIEKAKTALACIVEGLTKAGIPVKVMTFCEKGRFVEHHHYVNYKNSLAAKSSIMMIHAEGCNFDGYSIRFALKDLMRGRTKNTLMLVISDGKPNSHLVRNSTEDAAKAVREAKRRTKVIGIGVDANQDVLRSFYKETFVELKSIETLMSTLSKLIVKEVKSWA